MSSPVFLSDSVYFHFGTASATTGAATNADSTPSVTVSEDGVDMGYAPSVTNVTTGLYIVTIVASAANGFEAGRRYSVYATATVGGIAGRDGIAEFEVLAVDLNTSLDAAITSRLAPTVAARTLDVSAGGEAGIDWANIGSPTTAQNLSATNIDVDQVVASVSGAVGSVTGLTAANLDTTISSRMATYTQPTGFLAATFPGGTIANTTNITAGTITTVSGNVTGSVGSVTGLTAANLDVAVSSRFASASAPANFSSFAISAAGIASADIKYVNAILVSGAGTAGNPWGP